EEPPGRTQFACVLHRFEALTQAVECLPVVGHRLGWLVLGRQPFVGEGAEQPHLSACDGDLLRSQLSPRRLAHGYLCLLQVIPVLPPGKPHRPPVRLFTQVLSILLGPTLPPRPDGVCEWPLGYVAGVVSGGLARDGAE